jgi:L-fuconolactonase
VNRVDAHHHLWDTSGGVPGWLVPADMEPIRRSFDTSDLAAAAGSAGVDATVLVQTVHEVAETQQFLRLAEASPLIRAVTGWVELDRPGVTDRVQALQAGAGGGYLRALRHGAQSEPDDGWLARPAVVDGVRAAAAAGLVYELLVQPPQLPAALELVRSLPAAAFVLDHAGKPAIAADAWQPWADQDAALAAAPNVGCKLSGLVTEDGASWSVDRLRRYTDHLLDTFGPARLMWGSDWPVCLLRTDYARWAAAADELIAGLSADERAQVLAGTATRVYRLDP